MLTRTWRSGRPPELEGGHPIPCVVTYVAGTGGGHNEGGIHRSSSCSLLPLPIYAHPLRTPRTTRTAPGVVAESPGFPQIARGSCEGEAAPLRGPKIRTAGQSAREAVGQMPWGRLRCARWWLCKASRTMRLCFPIEMRRLEACLVG